VQTRHCRARTRLLLRHRKEGLIDITRSCTLNARSVGFVWGCSLTHNRAEPYESYEQIRNIYARTYHDGAARNSSGRGGACLPQPSTSLLCSSLLNSRQCVPVSVPVMNAVAPPICSTHTQHIHTRTLTLRPDPSSHCCCPHAGEGVVQHPPHWIPTARTDRRSDHRGTSVAWICAGPSTHPV
jgi:hypothetical protein